jgi:hypothetical protein
MELNFKSSKSNINLNISCKPIVISSMQSPSTLPNRPPILSVNEIQKMTSLIQLKKLEQKYDEFLDKNMQILLLYNVVEDYLELRDALTMRISKLRRESYLRFHLNRCFLEE